MTAAVRSAKCPAEFDPRNLGERTYMKVNVQQSIIKNPKKRLQFN